MGDKMAEEQDLENKAEPAKVKAPENAEAKEQNDKKEPVQSSAESVAKEPMTEQEAAKELQEKNATLAFQALSKKEMTEADKAFIADALSNDPNFLISKEFMAKIAPLDMNRCPTAEGEYQGYIAKSAQQLESTSQVLENLNALQQEGKIPVQKNGKTQVQHLIDESRLPNGETLGTQTVKNVMLLKAMQNDPAYPDKKGVSELEFNSGFLLERMYIKDELGANPNRRNSMGQKVGELMKSHLDDKKKRATLNVESTERKPLTVEQLKAKPYQKTLSRDELKVAQYRGTLTAEQAEQLKKMDNKDKEAEVKNQPGDWDKPQKRENNDKFKDEDVVKYMYEDWFLGGASWLCNAVENKVLGLIDNAANIFVESANRNRKLAAEIKDENLKNSINLLTDFDQVAAAVKKGKKDAYTAKAQNFGSIFDDLAQNIDSPNPQWKHQFDPKFIQALKADPKRHDFIKFGKEKILSDMSILQATDELSATITQIEMKDEFMRNIKAWKEDSKTLKTTEQLQAELEQRTIERQKKMLKAVSIITEDTRLIAEIAYESIQNPKLTKEEFIREQVSKSINDFLKEQQEQAKLLAEKQQEEVSKQNLDGRGKKDTDRGIKKGIKTMDSQLDTIISKGKMYEKEEFTDEKSSERIEKKTSLFEEAKAQNVPSVFEKYGELNALDASVIAARRHNNTDRKQQLAAFKERFENRDKKATIDKRIADMQQGASRD